MERGDTADELDALLARARTHRAEGEVATAWALCAEVARRARAEGDVDHLVEAALLLPRPSDLPTRGRVHAVAREALGKVAPDDPRRGRLEAQVAATRDPHVPAPGRAEPADLADPEVAFLRIQARVADLQHPAHVEERLALGDRALALGVAAGVEEYEAWGRRWRMDVAAELGRPLELATERSAVTPVAARLGPEWRSWLLLTRAASRLLEGGFDEAAAFCDEARDVGGPGSEAAFFHLVFATEQAVWTGRDAARLADEVAAILEGLPFLARGWLAESRLVAGDVEVARHVWNGIRSRVLSMPHDAPEWLIAATGHGALCEAFADVEVADQLHAILLPFADRCSAAVAHAPNYGPVALTLGRLALVSGRVEQARGHLEAALATATGLQALPHVALAHLTLARTYSTGSRARAEHASVAAGLARSLGAARLLASAEALLDAPPGDPRITPREAEVAALVAEGLTNGTIARRLVLSERTVENHVAHVLHKLDLTGRSSLAVWAREHLAGHPTPGSGTSTPDRVDG